MLPFTVYEADDLLSSAIRPSGIDGTHRALHLARQAARRQELGVNER